MSNSLLSGRELVYVRVREELREQISSLEEGAKLPSERDLSERFRVDRATLRRAMKDLEVEGYVVRYHGKGTFINKTPTIDPIENQSNIVALVTGHEDIPFNSRIISGIETEASSEDHRVLLCNSMLSNEREKEILETLSQLNVAGVLVVPFATDSLDPEFADQISRLSDSGMRIVMIDLYLPELNVPSVTTDQVQIGYAATEHLILLGHKRICYSCSASYDLSGRDCLRGYRMALQDYDLNYNDNLVIDVSAMNCAGPTHDAVVEILTRDPKAFTAIATPYFSMTHGIIQALNTLGKRIPQDIALVGGEVYQNPDYTYVTHTLQPALQMGEEALKLLLRNDDDQIRKRHVMIKPQLIIGETCGSKSYHQ